MRHLNDKWNKSCSNIFKFHAANYFNNKWLIIYFKNINYIYEKSMHDFKTQYINLVYIYFYFITLISA